MASRTAARPSRGQVAHSVTVEMDGVPALLVNLSAGGAQVVSPSMLRPDQHVRMVLRDPTSGPIPIHAVVRWSMLEIPDRRPRYRAGLEFVGADAAVIASIIDAHRG